MVAFLRFLPTSVRTVFAVALVLLPTARAQAIGDGHDVFLDAVGAVVTGERYVVGPLTMTTDVAGDVLVGVTLRGLLDPAGIAAASATFAVATGYGDGIRQPLASFLAERAESYVGQGPVPIRVEGYQLELDVTTGVLIGTPVAAMSLSLPRVSEAAFGPPVAILGDPDAAILIRVFNDFECPFCKRYAEQILPTLKQSVLASEDVALAFHHFPLNNIHANAEPAAVTSQCVQDLYGTDVFWRYHDRIFERQAAWGSLGDPYPYFVRLLSDTPEVVNAAGSAEQASSEVTACIEQGDALADVRSATNRGVLLGVQGTPTVFVGGHRLNDFDSPEGYVRLIRLERALAGLEGGPAQ